MTERGFPDVEVQADVARRICGRFVGEDISWLPGISAYGALIRTARLNHLRRAEFFAAYDLRTTRRDELSRVLTFSDKRKDALARALCVNERERDLWDITEWLPFSGNLDWESLPWEPRICPCCTRLGYHTLLFQLPWITRCPWHGANLIRYCRHCARPFSTASSSIPMKCRCGIDYVNVREACRHRQSHLRDMARWVSTYLAWASAAREANYLVHTPKPDVSNWDALGQLIEMPAALQARCGHARAEGTRLHERRLSIYDRVNPNINGLGPKFLLSVPVDIDGVVELPAPTWSAFRHVGYELAEKLPEATFSDGELLRFFAGSRRPALRFAATHRTGNVDILFLPVQVGGERGYLYVNAMAKTARDVVHRLGRYLEKETNNFDLPMRTGMLLLLRAYAEGMRVILSRFFPDLLNMQRDRPHLTLPWVLLQRQAGKTIGVKVVWTPRSDDCQAVLTPPTRNKRRPKSQAPIRPN